MNISKLREDFPTMRNGNGVYLDSACQSLRPDSVINAIVEYYRDYPSCGGRSVHNMSSTVSSRIDETREKLAEFFGTEDPDCYHFTKNCTEAINTVAYGLKFSKEDCVVTTDTEHNSNHVPWIILSERSSIERRFSKSNENGEFDIESFKSIMDKKVKLVSVQHCGNVTGCVTPIAEIAEIAHDCGAKIMVDGSQAAPHMKVDFKKLDVDFYCLSIHKMLGPSGMGLLYGKRECLEELRPLQYGGGAVGKTTYDSVEMAPIPDKFEAGLQDYGGIFGTKAALDYLSKIGFDNLERHENKMMRRIFKNLEDLKNLSIVGPRNPDKRCGVFSFNIDGLLSHDIAMMLDNMDNIMIRSGMHCAHPFYISRKIDGSARASIYLYNNERDIERFTDAVIKISEQFGNH